MFMRKLKIPATPVLREWYITFVVALALILCGCTLSYSPFLVPLLIEEGFDKSSTESWIGSVVNLAASVLVFFAAPLMGAVGRKFNLQIVFVVHMVGWTALISARDFFTVCLSLCMVAFGMVMTIPLTVTYISETCDKTRRGVYLSLDFVFIATGYSVDYLLHSYLTWRYIGVLFIVIAILGLLFSSIMPETKYWYLLQGDWKHAAKSYLWFHPLATSKEISEDLADIQTSIDEIGKITAWSFFRDIRKKKYLKGLLLGLILYVLRVCAGRPIFVTFTGKIFEDMDTPYDIDHLVVLYAIIDISGCIIVQYLVYKCNRKSLILCFSVIMISSLALASIYLYLHTTIKNPFPLFPVVCVYIYTLIVSTGYISTIGIMVSEILYAEYRGPTMALVTFGLFFTTLLLTRFYPSYKSVVSIEYMFIFFILSICFCVLLIFTFVPETARKEFYKTGF